MHGTTV